MSKRNPKRRSSESPLSVQFRSCKDLNQLGACDTMASPFDHDIQSSNWDVVPVPGKCSSVFSFVSLTTNVAALQDNYMYVLCKSMRFLKQTKLTANLPTARYLVIDRSTKKAVGVDGVGKSVVDGKSIKDTDTRHWLFLTRLICS